MKVRQNALPFTGVAAGSKATLMLPLGPTYNNILLQMGGTTFNNTHITGISLKRNGKPIMDSLTGPHAALINAYHQRPVDAAFLPICFEEANALNYAEKTIGCIASTGVDPKTGLGARVQNLALEIDIAAGAVAPTLSAMYVLDDPSNNQMVQRLLRAVSPAPAATGEFPITSVPIGAPSGTIKRIYMMEGSAGMITSVRCAGNTVNVFETTRVRHEYEQKSDKKTPQAGMFVLDFCSDTMIANALLGKSLNQLDLRVTIGAVAGITTYVEMLDHGGVI